MTLSWFFVLFNEDIFGPLNSRPTRTNDIELDASASEEDMRTSKLTR